MANLITISDIDVTFDDEPRIQDLKLAEALGMTRPRAIRQLIERNKPELEMYGSLATRRGANRGQEFIEYFPNEPQALLIMLRSDAPNAPNARKQVIEVCLAYRNGKTSQPALEAPKPINDPLLPKLAQAHSEIASLKAEVIYLRGQMKTFFAWLDKLIMGGSQP